MKPPVYKPNDADKIEAMGARMFPAGAYWVARFNGKQGVGVTREKAAKDLLQKLDTH